MISIIVNSSNIMITCYSGGTVVESYSYPISNFDMKLDSSSFYVVPLGKNIEDAVFICSRISSYLKIEV